MLFPDSRVRFAWDLMCLLIIGFETVSVPVTLAFAESDTPWYWAWFVVVFFAADICLNFFTGIQYRGIIVTSMQISAVRYLTSIWIWVDVISTVPWETVFAAESGSEAARLIRVLLCCV